MHVLRPLEAADVERVLVRALEDVEHGVGATAPGGVAFDVAPDALALVAGHAGGDARRGLTALDAVLADARERGTAQVTADDAARALAVRLPAYDKAGEQHYDLISAFIKAMRGSDPQGTLYWLARMVQGGEDPRYLARRMIRFASEDVGMADPRALEVAIAAGEAFRLLGSPEGELALAEGAVYLATAPKSNRVYAAWKAAQALAADTMTLPVPLHLRNAPTRLMAELGYGAGYRYAHDEADAVARQAHLPEALEGRVLYTPGPFGFEKDVAKRLEWWAARRAEAR